MKSIIFRYSFQIIDTHFFSKIDFEKTQVISYYHLFIMNAQLIRQIKY